jgi:starvation-inducible DNA-binding protein
MENSSASTATNSAKLAQALNVILADEFVLYTKTKNAFWNNSGSDSESKQSVFQAQVLMLDQLMDSVANKIIFLGHAAPASLKAFLGLTHFSETRSELKGSGLITGLLSDHDSLVIHLRESIKMYGAEVHDQEIKAYFISLLENHEEMVAALRTHR